MRLVAVVPLLLLSLYLVKGLKKFKAHRNLQLLLAGVILLTVLLFELDMRLHGGWEKIVNWPEGRLSVDQFATVRRVLYVHLVFAISTPILWGDPILQRCVIFRIPRCRALCWPGA
ncbi:MAG: hypothetical protein U0903_06600 [Planctomycetales bacterium]